MPKISKIVKRAQATGIIAGLNKHFSKGDAYPVGGKKLTGAQLIAVFQSHLDAIDELNAARAAVSAAVARERALANQARELTRWLKTMVELTFGPSPQRWADFGWQVPKKPGPKTIAAKLEGARKGRETRIARHTRGKRQKKKIRGW